MSSAGTGGSPLATAGIIMQILTSEVHYHTLEQVDMKAYSNQVDGLIVRQTDSDK